MFETPKAAVEAAVAIQRALPEEIVAPDVRIGAHAGGAFRNQFGVERLRRAGGARRRAHRSSGRCGRDPRQRGDARGHRSPRSVSPSCVKSRSRASRRPSRSSRSTGGERRARRALVPAGVATLLTQRPPARGRPPRRASLPGPRRPSSSSATSARSPGKGAHTACASTRALALRSQRRIVPRSRTARSARARPCRTTTTSATRAESSWTYAVPANARVTIVTLGAVPRSAVYLGLRARRDREGPQPAQAQALRAPPRLLGADRGRSRDAARPAVPAVSRWCVPPASDARMSHPRWMALCFAVGSTYFLIGRSPGTRSSSATRPTR